MEQFDRGKLLTSREIKAAVLAVLGIGSIAVSAPAPSVGVGWNIGWLSAGIILLAIALLIWLSSVRRRGDPDEWLG